MSKKLMMKVRFFVAGLLLVILADIVVRIAATVFEIPPHLERALGVLPPMLFAYMLGRRDESMR